MAVSIMTTKQITQLDHSMRAAHNVLLGTRINEMQYGNIPTIATGEVLPMAAIKYKTTPALASATAVHAAVLLVQTVTTTVTTGITNPDFPRILSVKGNDANVTGNVVITGTNFNNAVISDTIALSGASIVAGAKAFKTVTSIVLPPYAVAGTESVSIGTGAKLGFPIAIPNASTVIAKTFDGSADSTTVTAAATVEGSLAAAAGTFNGTKVYELIFLS